MTGSIQDSPLERFGPLLLNALAIAASLALAIPLAVTLAAPFLA